jgi:hypothetical protein
MENEEGKPQADQQSVVFVRDEDFAELYANHVNLESTIWDLQAVFGQLQTGPNGDPVVKQHTSIAFSWTQAKVMCVQLAMTIIGYEETRGPVRLPDAVLPLVLALNERAKKDPRIMSVVTALIQSGNPEAFGKIVYADATETPAPETTQRHVKPNTDSETPAPDTPAPKGSRQIRFEEDEKPTT